MLSYFDEELRLPLIETYVYLGQDLLGDKLREVDTISYFKRPDRFLATGYRLESNDLADCIRVGLDTIELVLDLGELITALHAVSARDGT
jgi:hypothetical protein